MKTGTLALKGFCVAVLAMFLGACGSSDDNDNNSSGIIGNWSFVSATNGGQTFTAQQMGMTIVVHINGDGTYTAVTTDETGTETETGRWSTSGNQLTITPTGDTPSTATYAVSGNNMSMTEDGTTMNFVRL